ncbi:MAG: 23S rRNA (uracil(1939)-C(5))-methyltransferase RlmD [Myxococcales bacterium]|nr:23S rRNA (uracil(1939)-C(5))-methyltransferase RlmD [Myxococcales bacterium]
MGRRKRRIQEPFVVEITGLGRKGVGLGTTPDGLPIEVRGIPPGTHVEVQARKKRKDLWEGYPLAIVQPPQGATPPRCSIFDLCGGCCLQSIDLASQRAAKQQYAIRSIAEGMGLTEDELAEDVTIHPIRGPQDAYAYRNKVELSFGVQRFMSKEDLDAGIPIDGRFLGFHAPGRFDRVVDAERCELISEAANQLMTTVRKHTLCEEAPKPWDVRDHSGFWRHLMLREGFASGEHLIGLYTAPATTTEEETIVEELAQALLQTPLQEGHQLAGIVWFENDSVADKTQGTIRKIWGRDWLNESLGDVGYHLSIHSFFQTSTPGATVLYDTIAEALQTDHKLLYDLYCGIGSIGLYLHQRFDQIVGLEEIPQAIEDARKNAQRNEIHNVTYHATRVEDALELLPQEQHDHTFVVDPPRVGLHPRVADTLAHAPGDELIYVACHPASLGRDAPKLAAGGWQLQQLWFVDLFPQTYHIEAIGRFVRVPLSPITETTTPE